MNTVKVTIWLTSTYETSLPVRKTLLFLLLYFKLLCNLAKLSRHFKHRNEPCPKYTVNPREKKSRLVLGLQKKQTYPWHFVHTTAHISRKTEAITLKDMLYFPYIRIFKELNEAILF